MTAAAIATTATVEAATITSVSCPFACSGKRKRRAVRIPARAPLAQWTGMTSKRVSSSSAGTTNKAGPRPGDRGALRQDPRRQHRSA
jgi:hypothetical protein